MMITKTLWTSLKKALLYSDETRKYDFEYRERREQDKAVLGLAVGLILSCSLHSIFFQVPLALNALLFVYALLSLVLIRFQWYRAHNIISMLYWMIRYLIYEANEDTISIFIIRGGELISLLCLTGSSFWVLVTALTTNFYFHAWTAPNFRARFQKMSHTELVELFEKGIATSDRIILLMLISVLCYLYRRRRLLERVRKRELQLQIKAKELEEYTKLLKRTIQEKEDFILSFSHELRNPLNGLLGNLEIAMHKKTVEEVKIYLRKAQICSEILQNFLTSILDSTKVDKGKLEVIASETNTQEFFERIWAVISDMILSKRLKGYLNLSCKVPKYLLIDNRRLTQILLNLAGNAVKFTKEGYVYVNVNWIAAPKSSRTNLPSPDQSLKDLDTQENAEVGQAMSLRTMEIANKPFDYYTLDTNKFMFSAHETFLENDEEGELSIVVGDTGCGISESKLPYIFKKFSQVDDRSEVRMLGAGLGLWITKSIVDAMGGDIKLNSKENVGTTFEVQLPCIPAIKEIKLAGLKDAIKGTETSIRPSIDKSSSPLKQSCCSVEKSSPPPKQNEKKLRALVVDDSPQNQSMNCQLLQKSGIEIIDFAENGSKALETFTQLPEYSFDVVIIDSNNTSEMNGTEVCKLIREYEKQKNLTPVTVILVIDVFSEKKNNECLNQSETILPDYYLEKPFSQTVLESMLTELSQKKSNNPLPKIQPQPQRTVLLCDDQVFNVDLLENFVTEEGGQAIRAYNGEEAVALTKKYWKEIDLILIDNHMPVMDGIQALKEISQFFKDTPKCDAVKMYLLTGDQANSQLLKDAHDLNIQGILHKPITRQEISKLMKQIN